MPKLCRNSPYASAPVSPPVLLTGLDSELHTANVRAVKVRLLAIARSITAGHIGLLDGCSAFAAPAFPLNDEGPLEDLLRGFARVPGEIDEYPVGSTGELWAKDALEAKDAEFREFEQRVRLGVLADCAQLQAVLVKDLTA